MEPDHIRRTVGDVSHGIEIEVRSVGRKNGVTPRDRGQAPEEILLDLQVLEHRLDDEIDGCQSRPIDGGAKCDCRSDACKPATFRSSRGRRNTPRCGCGLAPAPPRPLPTARRRSRHRARQWRYPTPSCRHRSRRSIGWNAVARPPGPDAWRLAFREELMPQGRASREPRSPRIAIAPWRALRRSLGLR